MKGQRFLEFGLRSVLDFRSADLANSVLDAIDAAHPLLVPETYGPYQPLQEPYSPDRRYAIVEAWMDGSLVPNVHPFWTGTLLLDGPRSSRAGYWVSWKRGEPMFNGISLQVDLNFVATPVGMVALLDLVRELVQRTDAVYAAVRNLMFPGWDLPYDLRVRMPQPGWKLFLGRPYLELFGEQKLLSIPCAQVDRLSSGHVEVTMSDSPFDAVSTDAVRAVRDHLGADAFMDPGKSVRSYQSGLAPLFDFAAIVDPPV